MGHRILALFVAIVGAGLLMFAVAHICRSNKDILWLIAAIVGWSCVQFVATKAEPESHIKIEAPLDFNKLHELAPPAFDAEKPRHDAEVKMKLVDDGPDDQDKKREELESCLRNLGLKNKDAERRASEVLCENPHGKLEDLIKSAIKPAT